MDIRRTLDEPPEKLFSTADVFAMLDAGVLSHDEKIELIEGRIYRMSPKKNDHEWAKARLARWLIRNVPDRFIVGVEQTIYFNETTFLEPEFVIHRADLKPEDVRGSDIVLVVEVSASSLSFDLKRKAPLYARFGVRDLWVVDAKALETHVHATPLSSDYSVLETVGGDTSLPLPFDPTLSFRLREIAGPNV